MACRSPWLCSLSSEMKQVVHARYEAFEKNRRAAEASLADADDLKAIEQLESQIQGKKA